MNCIGNHLNIVGLCWLIGSWLFMFVCGHFDGRMRAYMGKSDG